MTASALMTLAFYALVVESMLIILLIIPLISPAMWSRLLSSNFCKMIQKRGRVPFYVALLFMGLIFFDASRVERQSRDAKAAAGPDASHHTLEHLNSRLFRAQRDLYIAGFGLFFVFIIYRLIKVVSEIARLDASCTAALRQAESASRVAEMSLKAEPTKAPTENPELEAELEKKNQEIERLRTDLEAMRRQSENLSKEYDRLAEEHANAVNKGDKKSE